LLIIYHLTNFYLAVEGYSLYQLLTIALIVCMSWASTLARHRRRSPGDHNNSNKILQPKSYHSQLWWARSHTDTIICIIYVLQCVDNVNVIRNWYVYETFIGVTVKMVVVCCSNFHRKHISQPIWRVAKMKYTTVLTSNKRGELDKDVKH